MEAANQLLKVGSTPDEARAVLGEEGRLGRFHGQFLTGSNMVFVEKWEMEFPTSEGAIVLMFHEQSNTQGRLGFKGAVYRRFIEVTPEN